MPRATRLAPVHTLRGNGRRKGPRRQTGGGWKVRTEPQGGIRRVRRADAIREARPGRRAGEGTQRNRTLWRRGDTDSLAQPTTLVPCLVARGRRRRLLCYVSPTPPLRFPQQIFGFAHRVLVFVDVRGHIQEDSLPYRCVQPEDAVRRRTPSCLQVRSATVLSCSPAPPALPTRARGGQSRRLSYSQRSPCRLSRARSFSARS